MNCIRAIIGRESYVRWMPPGDMNVKYGPKTSSLLLCLYSWLRLRIQLVPLFEPSCGNFYRKRYIHIPELILAILIAITSITVAIGSIFFVFKVWRGRFTSKVFTIALWPGWLFQSLYMYYELYMATSGAALFFMAESETFAQEEQVKSCSPAMLRFVPLFIDCKEVLCYFIADLIWLHIEGYIMWHYSCRANRMGVDLNEEDKAYEAFLNHERMLSEARSDQKEIAKFKRRKIIPQALGGIEIMEGVKIGYTEHG